MTTTPSNPHETWQTSARFSTAIVLFHTAVADSVGLNLTDYKCLELMLRKRITHPGVLSAEAGLSTATTTLVLDRLEKKGLVKRSADPADRRKVVLKARVTPKFAARFNAAMKDMIEGMTELMETFSQAEQAVIDRYVRGSTTVLEKSLVGLRQS